MQKEDKACIVERDWTHKGKDVLPWLRLRQWSEWAPFFWLYC